METPLEALNRAIAALEGQGKLAAVLGVTSEAISGWKRSGRTPAGRVLDVERASKVSRHVLRPDLYPVEAPSAERAA